MSVSVYAANEGYLKAITIAQILPFESAMHSYMKS
jgi:F-type H+-transporting ATPase subunit alpha